MKTIEFKHLQVGQSLVEFIFIIPLFFIILSGVNLYLNQKIKSITEQSAYESLMIADAVFESEERERSHWATSQKNTLNYGNDILTHALNSSSFFKNSVDTSDKVFIDKKNVQSKNQISCDKITSPSFYLSTIKQGDFNFSTCSDGSGFESSSFSYQKMIEDFKSTKVNYIGQSIYYPSEKFSWDNRKYTIKNAVRDFQTNIQSFAFSKEYASFDYSQISSSKPEYQFNTNCLMNSKKSYCFIPTLEKKWRRIAFNSANKQVLGCLSEASIKCLSLATPATIAICVAEKSASIVAALRTGTKVLDCPLINKALEFKYNTALKLLDMNSAKIYSQEFLFRNQ